MYLFMQWWLYYIILQYCNVIGQHLLGQNTVGGFFFVFFGVKYVLDKFWDVL